MQVMEFHDHGGPEVLRPAERPTPTPGPGEVLVEIRAASVNAADWKVRSGKTAYEHKLPHVPGRDFSGVVVAVGEGADLAKGDEVFGVCPQETEGAYASHIVFPAKLCGPKPASLSHVETVAIALAGLTAMISLEETLALQKGEKLLIQGGAGGVGGMAIQLAAHLGAEVAATARAENHDHLRKLGATLPLDYRDADWLERMGPRDAVFDCVGGSTIETSFAALRPGGRAAFIGSGPKAPTSPRDDVISLRPAVIRSRDRLARMAALAHQGVWGPSVIETLPLTEAVEAHRRSEAGHVRGKLVLLP